VTAGQYDDGNGRVPFADLTQEIEPFEIGQPEVEDHEVRLGCELLQGGSRVGGFQHLVTLGGEAHTQQLADGGLVIDDEQTERRRVHATGSTSRVVSATGSVTVNTAPERSERLPATTRPCMASMNPRDTASPRPVPARTLSSLCTR